MNILFNTQDNQEFLGIRSDASLNKANKKGTPQYEEWLRQYREKRAGKKDDSPSEKDKKRAETLTLLAKKGKFSSIEKLFNQIKDEKKIQKRYDLLKENLSEEETKKLNRYVSYLVPSLKEEKAKRAELKQRYKNHIKARLEPLSKRWNEKFTAHFKKITDKDKAYQRLDFLQANLGKDNPALEGIEDLVKKTAIKEQRRGYQGNYSLQRKNEQRARELLDGYKKDLEQYDLTVNDFSLISDVGDGFYSRLKEMI